ncbi:cell wall-binding repeat-containing protein [Peptostreptococcus porci]|uniref:cell wall-binding repeat-containing protein n=1 Tax=Peptostreptococcus porci TaxID=2652282 RepID=UPI002A914BB6|nr:cell wall-binding repeat-containing protein [Peptostreptococcus porci]MDY5435270.1 cell wall-binding repeat-containing protein [Peptostreptococcus porci]
MKKQLAVLMAAATAVTTVAPVLASAEILGVNDASVSQVNAAIKKALDTRYADKKQDGVNESNSDEVDAYMNSRYAVLATGLAENKDKGVLNLTDDKCGYKTDKAKRALGKVATENGVVVITDAAKAVSVIENAMLGNNPNIKVYIVDKGIKDNSSVYVTDSKIIKTEDDLVALKGKFDEKGVSADDKVSYLKNVTEIKDGVLTVNLTSGTKLTFKIGDETPDLNKAYAKDGQELDLVVNSNQQSVHDQVVKFGVEKNADEKKVTEDVVSGDTVVYTLANVENSVIDVPTIFTNENGYTEKGAELVNKLIKANNEDPNLKFNYEGVNYELTAKGALDTANAKIEKIGDKYVLKIKATVKDANDTAVQKTIQFNIEGKVQKDLVRVLNDLKGKTPVVVGQFVKLAGADRFATAIEVSNERFEKGKADSVVIVGATALMDGLSAVPLASVKNAPVLLADAKNGLSADTVAEIKRAAKDLNRKTVYIVGGTNSVPTSVDKTLQEKFGAVVVRLSGADRYETSLDVARRLKYDGVVNNTAYVVGGEGAADAMSISSVAAKKENDQVSPVLVVPQKGISRTTRDFVAGLELAKAYVIGGESSVSTQVLKDVKLAKAATDVSRISGADRYATNVEVLKTFFTKDKVGGLVVTSGDTKFLVDSQTAGALAAKNDAPILLTGAKLTSDQLSLFKKDGLFSGLASLSGRTSKVFQVGGVVSADVMKAIVEKLGL